MKPRVLFFSAAEISIPCLDFLKNNLTIDFVGVVTQPSRAKGRGQKLSLNFVAEWAKNSGLPFIEAEKMNDEVFVALKKLKPDLIFVMAFGHILKQHFLTLPSLGMWNLHTSLLPKFRGASPIQSAILKGEQRTGVTLMSMVEKMDAGPWIDQEVVDINEDTTVTLSRKLAEKSVLLLQRSLPKIISRTYKYTVQDETLVTFCRKFSKLDGLLDFSKPAIDLERQIRAFQPWPGSYFFRGSERYIVYKAHVEVGSMDVGEIEITENYSELHIGTGNGILVIDVIQKTGGKPMAIVDFLRGNKII